MTTSNNDKRVLNVPPLRFPDFKGEWATTTLGSLVDFKNGINADSSKYGSGIKYISVSDVLDQHPILYESIRGSMIASEDQLREFSVTYGDILFQRSSETVEDIGQANVYLDNKPCLFGGFVIRGKKKADYNPLYMKYALKAPINRKKVIIKGAGAQHYNIGQENLFSIPISICGKEEQAKISSLLSDLDLRIDVQRKIIEEYTKQMSSLFAFLNSGAKELHFFSEIGPLAKTDSLSWGDISCEGKNKCILYGELFTKYHYQVSKAVSKTNAESKNASEGNELLFPSSTTVDAVSLISPCALNEAGVIMGGDLFAIRVCSKFNALYLSFLFNCIYKNRLAKYAQGTTIIHLHYDDIKNFRFQSVSLDKQNKICEIMEDELEKIDVEQKELRAIKNVKTHLLKNLFI